MGGENTTFILNSAEAKSLEMDKKYIGILYIPIPIGAFQAIYICHHVMILTIV